MTLFSGVEGNGEVHVFFTPQLALKNATGSTETVTVTVQYTVNGQFQSQTLPAIDLAPHDVRKVDFSDLLDSLRKVPVAAAGLRVESSGAPGSLVAALSSIDGAGSLRVDVPLVSVDASVYRGGNHPIRLRELLRSSPEHDYL